MGRDCGSGGTILSESPSAKSLKNDTRLLCDLDESMASVMAKGSEVFDECLEEIAVSVEEGNSEVLLCQGWKYIRLAKV